MRGGADLVPRDNVERWLKYLRNEFPTVAFKASTQTQRNHIGRSSVPVERATADALQSSECLGAAHRAMAGGAGPAPMAADAPRVCRAGFACAPRQAPTR